MSSHFGRKVAVERDDDQNEILQGEALVGREINLVWEDGNRYDAVVVRYYKKDDEYKLVYIADDGVEVANIDDRDWYLLSKRYSTPEDPVLIGAIVKFIYPDDKKMYKAMIYQAEPLGERLRVCYLDEHSTDAIGGRGWSFVTSSPCAHSNYDLYQQQLLAEKAEAELVKTEDEEKVDAEHDDENSVPPPPPPPPTSAAAQRQALRKGRAGATRSVTTDNNLDVRKGRVAKKPWVKG